jgi:predicted nucleic acid-binding protein
MTSGLVVSNAGPLITLAKIQRSQLLKGLFGQIVIPRAVFDEVVLRGAGEPGAEETRNARWIEISLAVDVLSVSLLRESLGAGESEAIVLAQELGADLLLLDDALARRKAERLGLKAIGTLGVLLLAKEAGLLDAVKPVLIELQRTDFRASLRVYEEVLARAGEN